MYRKNEICLFDKLNKIHLPKIKKLEKDEAKTIDEFWKKCIEPMLPSKNIVISWYKLFKKYINDKDAVFAIRTYGSWTSKKHNNKELR